MTFSEKFFAKSPFKQDPPKNPVIYYDKGGKMISRSQWDKTWEPSLEGIKQSDLIKSWSKNPRSKNVNWDKKPNIRKKD